jgi:hypothetical protein
MKSPDKIIAVLFLIAVSMGAGAAIYAGFGPEPEPGVQADTPTLTQDQAYSLARSYIIANTSHPDYWLSRECLGNKISPLADYRGNGLWAVTTEGGCLRRQ